ncbi:MAG: hypothetical protein E7383_00460 [Ruminococcaceae bacterium]|nr:hypothetical protein [Oscillospiraceae bacterium]
MYTVNINELVEYLNSATEYSENEIILYVYAVHKYLYTHNIVTQKKVIKSYNGTIESVEICDEVYSYYDSFEHEIDYQDLIEEVAWETGLDKTDVDKLTDAEFEFHYDKVNE